MDPKLSPGSWLEYLEARLDDQIAVVQNYQDYYDGKQRLMYATAKFREAFSRYFPPMANNWMKIVVNAPVSRLTVMGFRFNQQGRQDDAEGSEKTPPWELKTDEDAWRIWQANNLDAGSRQLHTEAVKLGVAYLLVAPPREGSKWPKITIEKATQCYVETDPEDPIRRLAGFKRWVSDFDGYAYANLFLPDRVMKFRSTSPHREGKKIQWTGLEAVSNPAGVVPLVPIENNPDPEYGGRSDLEDAIPIQDALNKYCLDMQVSSEFHAFPQRWAAGWETTEDDRGRKISGREVELFLSSARLVRAESAETKFGQFATGNVEEYLRPIETYIEHLLSQTQTPLYYLKQAKNSGRMSADAMHAEDQGLVDRCNAKILSFSDGYEESMRTAFLMMNDQVRGRAESAEILWKDPESKSLAVVSQAAMIWRTQLQVPVEMCWELLGFSPQQIVMARELMDLPPGGGPPPSAMQIPGPGAQGHNPNDPTTHPGNQRGQPSGQASQSKAVGGVRSER